MTLAVFQKEEKIRLLRQRLAERESQIKVSEANGSGINAVGPTSGHAVGTAITTMSYNTTPAAATTAITQGKWI